MPIEFYAACEGYEEMKLESARLLRFSTYRIAEAMAGTKAVGTMESFWPLPKDKQAEKLPPMTKERYEAILKRHNVKIK